MGLPLLLGVLFSGFMWSFFDLSRKKFSLKISPLSSVVLLMFFHIPFLLPINLIDPVVFPTSGYWIPLVFSTALGVLANVFFIQSINLAPFSTTLPILTFTPVFSSMASYILIDERLTLIQVLGIILICVGAFLLTYEKSSLENKETRKGLILMLIVAIIWSISPVADKICLKYSSSGVHSIIQCFWIMVTLVIYARIRNIQLDLKKSFRLSRNWLLIASLAGALALGSQFIVIQQMDVALFEALKRTLGLFFSAYYGYFIFKERISKQKIISLIIMGIGVYTLLVL